MEKVKIKTEYIKLDQFIKFIGVAENGAHAKEIILYENIYVNDELEKKRGKKLYKKDIISIKDKKYIID